ncbi:putative quinol monooxygenase [Chitinimonas koreensis]|uniref:putative quinol monooxygenase n=1 Tax=Chitinimonas koreensis TaxID=356302 RepID=UPI0003FFF3ED|nr:putative quinol monooxygenase [Chitinimonas koreensis]QNM96111.1 antibiotic biosynthesis monooxygenase [Chitinimonas koreensis]
MNTLTVVATIAARPGSEALVEAALQALIEPTRREAGCIEYVLHRDQAEPRTFVFVERWSDAAALDAHLQSPHLADYLRRVDGQVEHWQVRRLDRIGR